MGMQEIGPPQKLRLARTLLVTAGGNGERGRPPIRSPVERAKGGGANIKNAKFCRFFQLAFTYSSSRVRRSSRVASSANDNLKMRRGAFWDARNGISLEMGEAVEKITPSCPMDPGDRLLMSMSAAIRLSAENDRLLEAARTGDRTAFGRLVEAYRPYLKSIALRILAERLPSDGSDVVQTGISMALERLAQFQGREPAAFLGWLAAIVRNEAMRLLRRAGRLQPLPEGVAGDELPGGSSGPDVKAARRERAAGLLAAVERLPEDYRTVIELRNAKDLPFEIVAQRMERSIPAVRKLWNRALDRLRDEVGEQL